jgi:PadR family transcriptional regulator PadR
VSRDTLGEFEQLVLLAALRLGEEAYAVSVLEEIESHTGRRPSHGAVFVALRRLEKKGLIQQELGTPTESRGGRPPRMVTVAPEALAKLRESRSALLSLWQGLDKVTGEGA